MKKVLQSAVAFVASLVLFLYVKEINIFFMYSSCAVLIVSAAAFLIITIDRLILIFKQLKQN